MAAFSASPTLSRILRSFIVGVFLGCRIPHVYRVIWKSGRKVGEAESTTTDVSTGLRFSCIAVSRWCLYHRPLLMLRHGPRRKVYLSSRLSYYPNFTASLNLTRLALCGDINPNPGPHTIERRKSNCKTCEQTLAWNHRTVWCQGCKFSHHLKCSGLSMKNYKHVQLKYWIFLDF